MPLLPINIYAPGDTIPSQWANDLRSNQETLSTRTGGDPGPGATARFLAVQSPTTGVWRALNAGDFAPGTIPDYAMANLKVNSLNPTYPSMAAMANGGSGFFEAASAADSPNGTFHWLTMQNRHWNYAAGDYSWKIAVALHTVNEIYIRQVIASAPGPWLKMWHAGNDGAGSGLDADLLDGLQPGNGLGQIPISNNQQSTGLNAQYLNGLTAAQISGGGAAAAVPPGVTAMWRSAGAPTGWVVDPAFNDRFPIGAGATYGLNTLGGQLNHGHGFNHDHGGPNLNTTPTVGGAVNPNNVATPGVNNANDQHYHQFDVPAFVGSTDGVPTGVLLPPYIAVTFIVKT